MIGVMLVIDLGLLFATRDPVQLLVKSVAISTLNRLETLKNAISPTLNKDFLASHFSPESLDNKVFVWAIHMNFIGK